MYRRMVMWLTCSRSAAFGIVSNSSPSTHERIAVATWMVTRSLLVQVYLNCV